MQCVWPRDGSKILFTLYHYDNIDCLTTTIKVARSMSISHIFFTVASSLRWISFLLNTDVSRSWHQKTLMRSGNKKRLLWAFPSAFNQFPIFVVAPTRLVLFKTFLWGFPQIRRGYKIETMWWFWVLFAAPSRVSAHCGAESPHDSIRQHVSALRL